jgi:hypothetical protein
MNRKTPQISDEDNTSFPQSSSSVDASAGFEVGDHRAHGGEAAKGQQRFPRRKSKEEIPQEPLAERLRAKRQGS